MRTMAIIAASAIAIAAVWYYDIPHQISDKVECDAPSGAMDAIRYQEMFIGDLHDFKFGCIPMVRGVCGSYSCTEFTAVDSDDKHIIGYVWRDVTNEPHSRTCSPDGGKSGTFYGECPVGTPAPTVYRCPWCEPNLNAKADLRGKRL